jgi:hypothetical protein
MSIARHVQGMVQFSFYRAGNLYYKTETGIEFPVPAFDADQQSATFLATDKAIYYMRWIRRHLEALDSAEQFG